ncbi:MAG: hypothetical protein QOI38_2556 [Sphingomonadales bacterium]|jgi:hypothetical protein|nr:hypothetical protein [Sphingomonadales bacterium]
MPTSLSPWRALACLALLAAAAAAASVPTGAYFGPWHVISISSASGDSRDDAVAMIVQERRGDALQVGWEQGGSVIVSIDIDRCGDPDEDFERSDRIGEAQWLAMADGGAARLRADFSGWLAEARRLCPRRAAAFRLAALAAAARDFTARLRALGAR